MNSENAIQSFLSATQNGDTPMFEIDISKYKKYATACGTYDYDGKGYILEFPVNPETYRRPLGSSFWEKYDAKRVFIDIYYLDEHANWADADKKAEVYLKDHLDELLEQSATRIYEDYSSKGFASYFRDYRGIWKYNREDKGPRIYWRLTDDSYQERYMSLRKRLSVPGGRRRYMISKFLKVIVDDLNVTDFDTALEMFEHDPDRFSFPPVDTTYFAGYDMNDPIITISKPDIVRQTGNKNTKTFDFINVEILLRSTLTFTDFDEFIRENLYDFNKRVLEAIGEDRRYQRFGVPTEFLSLYSISKHARTGLRFSYEIKRI